MLGPIIRGERLTLRPPVEADLATFIAWFADMDVTRYMLRRHPLSIVQEQDWFKRTSEDNSTVMWAIEVDGRLVGVNGIHAIDWINRHGTTGIGIGDKTQWRKGIASEAMVLRTRYAFRELNLHKLKSSAFMENEGSRRALVKAGYREVGVHRQEMYREGRWHDLWVAEVLREDWERAHGGQ